MLKPGAARGLQACIQSPASWPLPKSSWTHWAPLQKVATEPPSCTLATSGRHFSRGMLSGEVCHCLFCSGSVLFKKTTDRLCSRALRLSVGVASPRCLPGLGSPGLHPLPLPESPRPPCVAKGALSIKTACGECMSPTKVAAPIGGGEAVPGLGCDGHLHAEGRGQRYGTHVQGLEGGIQGVEGRAGAP